MDGLLNCGANGWLMAAGGIIAYGVLILAAAALVKFLFFAGRRSAAGEEQLRPGEALHGKTLRQWPGRSQCWTRSAANTIAPRVLRAQAV